MGAMVRDRWDGLAKRNRKCVATFSGLKWQANNGRGLLAGLVVSGDKSNKVPDSVGHGLTKGELG
jgi:hypothetical protein